MVLLAVAVSRMPPWIAILSLVVGVLGLVSFLVFVSAPSVGLGTGLERLAGYPVAVWMIVVGSFLLGSAIWSDRPPAHLRLGFAGDTYNTAVYLRRVAAELDLGLEVGYLTGVGDDDYSGAMREAWRLEGITDRSLELPGRTAGLYAIRTAANGERSFTYWRQQSAASEVFKGSDWCRALEGDVVHLSGITLQLTSPRSRETLVARLAALRATGAWVSLDTNYRPAGWSSGREAASAIDAVCGVATVVLASRDDETLLHGPAAPEASVRRITGLGAREVILRDGGAGAYVGTDGDVQHVPARRVARVIDTTAAGDAFAGGYLAARLAGYAPASVPDLGNGVAAVVIQHPGAIAPPGIRLSRPGGPGP